MGCCLQEIDEGPRSIDVPAGTASRNWWFFSVGYYWRVFWTLPNYLCCCKHCNHGHGWARNVKSCTLHVICINQLQLTAEIPGTIVRMLGVLGSMAVFSTLAHQWVMAVFPSSRWVHRWREVEQTGCQKPASGTSCFGVFQRMIGIDGLTMEVTDVRWCECYIGCCNQSLSSSSLKFNIVFFCWDWQHGKLERTTLMMWSNVVNHVEKSAYFSISPDRSNGMSSNAKGYWLKSCWMQRFFQELKVFQMLMKY